MPKEMFDTGGSTGGTFPPSSSQSNLGLGSRQKSFSAPLTCAGSHVP